MAHHMGSANILVNNLVGASVGRRISRQVLAWIDAPGAPNLYWSLTVLPDPFIDIRRTLEHEFGTLHRSFPQLRTLGKMRLQAQAQEMTAEFYRILTRCRTSSRAAPKTDRRMTRSGRWPP
jgi:hypothetical protein